MMINNTHSVRTIIKSCLRQALLCCLVFNLQYTLAKSSFLADEEFKNRYCHSQATFGEAERTSLEACTEKRFGALQACDLIEKNVRILTYSGGFAIFFPEQLWKSFDRGVSDYMNMIEGAPCWIANPTYTILKIDNEFSLDEAKAFVKRYFFDNPQAYPQNPLFSIGSHLEFPDMQRPFRARLGGGFSIP